MKIVFTVKKLSVTGGAEKVLSMIASSLSLKGHNIYIITNDNELPFYELNTNVKIINVYSNKILFRINFFNQIYLIIKTRKYIKSIRPDSVVSFMISSYISSLIAVINLKIPIFASEHTTYEYYKKSWFKKILLFLFLKHFNKVIAVSKQAKQSFPKCMQSNMIFINNPVDDNKFKLKADTIGKDNKNVIISVGRLCESKNHLLLIKSFQKILPESNNWVLHIYGDGELKNSLIDYINEHNLQKKVILKGLAINIYEVLSKAQLFVTTSKYESLGLSVVEALNVGLPSIAFKKCSGVNMLIKNNYNGILVEGSMDSDVELSKVLLNLLKNSEKRKQLASNCYLDLSFDINTISNEWINLLKFNYV